MISLLRTAAIPALLALAACSTENQTPDNARPPSDGTDPGAGTRPSGEPTLVTYEGRLEEGTECSVLHTPDGRRFAVNLGEADFGPGDYVAITGDLADASFCMEGDGTLVPRSISEKEPPARDRDPARAGGLALTEKYLTGNWVAKGLAADCDNPDFRIVASPAVVVLQGDISRHDDSVRVALDQYPRLDFDEPLPDLPIESRGPDGLAILRPATDAAYEPVSIGAATITGDGVVFVKCRS
jgi:hypothetical protein